MRKIGLETVYFWPKTGMPHPERLFYPTWNRAAGLSNKWKPPLHVTGYIRVVEF